MGTQFMPSSAYYGPQAPVNGYNGYPGGKNGGFSFRKRVERVDWRKIASVDVDNISRTLDFTTLQENIMNLTFCNLEAELDIRSVDPNFVKLFKLAQLTIEYLLHSQEYLAGLCASLEEKSKQSDQDVEKVKQELEEARKELTEVKKESHKRKKMLIAQQQLMYAGNESYNKCPFCAKAFMNNSYLQSHITRRHTAGTGANKDNSSTVSPDLGMGSDSGHNQMETELSQIKERLLKQEAELQEERRALLSLKNKDPRFIKSQSSENLAAPDGNENGEGGGGMSSAIMKEMKELNAKYQASQRALTELEARSGGKRSYLGDLEDDVENDKDLLKEQRSEVAALKEQLQEQLNQMSEHMQHKLTRQDKKWQKKVYQMTQQHASEIKKLNNVLESTSRSLDGSVSPHHQRQQQQVEEVLRQSREQEKVLEAQEQLIEQEISRVSEVKSLKSPGRRGHTPRGHTPRGHTPRGTTPREVIKHSSMYPSDEEDEESAAFGTGTSSLRTLDRNTGHASTLGQTGTQSLHASQFLEELRKNPTLAVMRTELAALLQEHVEKKGIPPNQTGISDQVLKNKLSMLDTQRQGHVQKYLNFHALRDHFNKVATEKAKKQLRQMTSSPRGPPPSAGPRRRLDMSPHTPRQYPSSPGGPRPGAPHPQQNLTPGRATTPRNKSPTPQPRSARQGAKTPLSTGSTTEWTSTQFDSDEDDSEDDYEDEEEDDPASVRGKAFVPSPGARLIQSGPARQGAPSPSPRMQGPKPRLIQSRPMSGSADDDIEDLIESEGEDRHGMPSPSSRLTSPKRSPGGGVSNLRDTIENKLGSRSPGAKPFGGVDMARPGTQNKTANNVGNLDEESDWDDTTAPDEPVPAGQRYGFMQLFFIRTTFYFGILGT
ncbi:zinc finger protein DZIP1L [Aplysia californica]|uniref:Zinc finger protein DZIP1L n=1 Tax=Aplysia californica TaxID=6500 RepID=A0ABM1A1P8_APLCA|nr:zinc finger protein DZIP1L [Aplysia californica]